MKIKEVPEGDWMLLDKKRNVLFHSKSCGEVCEEGTKYPIGSVYIEHKFTGICAF